MKLLVGMNVLLTWIVVMDNVSVYTCPNTPSYTKVSGCQVGKGPWGACLWRNTSERWAGMGFGCNESWVWLGGEAQLAAMPLGLFLSGHRAHS